MYFLGIDVGTSGSRAVIVDGSGSVSGTAAEGHEPFRSPRGGWAEQDPDDWWRASSLAIQRAIKDAGVDPDAIGSVSFSGQMHGAVLLGGDGRPLAPSIIWCDNRAVEECRELTENVGAKRLIQLVSNPALPNFTLPKLLWARKHWPEVWEGVRTVTLPKDYVRTRLSGDRSLDLADGSGTLMLDVVQRSWSQEILEDAEIERSLLPDLVESPEITGEVSRSASRETGLRQGTPVVAGAGDNAAAAIGMGIVRPGDVSVTVGTSGVVFAATEAPKTDPLGRIHTLCHAIPKTWQVTGVTQAAGLSFQWFRDTLASGRSYGDLTAEASMIPPGAEGLLWAPYLMGERTPHIDPNARASLIGLSTRHTRGHIVRAILEGVAFSLRDCIEIFREVGIPIERIRLGGGGARSALWRQIQADIYGHQVEIVEADEGAAFGAAILAGVGAGHWSSVPEACERSIRVAEQIDPDKENSSLLGERYEQFRKIYGALKEVK
ncbi:MAG: xylulokinase [Acidobacteria bacterium]|nr:MAG: xylulokinase [Acidobacteriota bacterium]REJ98683.1 MAG: xylulokinase [Acidobacteriota bacterium]REK16661.1 MAG: xylulokinase [Acidobacteriota bacterium]REK42572.1 MAG: xylulokinase [Acidobacteriota bacterium]